MNAGQKTDNSRQIQGGEKKEEHSQMHKEIFEILQGRKKEEDSSLPADPKWQWINEDASPAMSFGIHLID